MKIDKTIGFGLIIMFFALYQASLLYLAYTEFQKGNANIAGGILIVSLLSLPQLTWDSDK